MDLTLNEGLPFPGGYDPGDGALDLQVLAEAIDSNVALKMTHFRSIINRPCRISRLNATTGSMTAGANFNIYSVGSPNWVSLYNSTPSMLPGANPFQSVGLGSNAGIFHVGAFVQTNPIGAVTVNSERTLSIEAIIPGDNTDYPVTTISKYSRSRTFETNAGSQFQMCELQFFTPYPEVGTGASGTTITAQFFHANVASSVALFPGSLLWIYRAGDVDF